jgi:hypothetical protein
MKIQTRSPTFLPVLSTSPIDYYNGGTVRLNTEFYSLDTSFGRVNPLPRYSCLQVVFCVDLGTFLNCFLQLGWRLTGVRSTLTESPLNVPQMFPVYRCGNTRTSPRSRRPSTARPRSSTTGSPPSWSRAGTSWTSSPAPLIRSARHHTRNAKGEGKPHHSCIQTRVQPPRLPYVSASSTSRRVPGR